MRLCNSISGKVALIAASATASALFLGASGAQEKALKKVYGAISILNDGQVARHFDVSIFQKKGLTREKLAESVSVWIGAGGNFAWNRAIVGKSYRVQVTAQPAGTVVYDGTNVAGAGGVEDPIPIDPNPGEEDPRDAQIVSLTQQLADATTACDARVATVSAGYDTQVAALNTQVTDLSAQVAALQTELEGLVMPLGAQRDASFAAPSILAGTLKVEVAQFTLAASDVQGVTITRLTFDKDLDKEADLANLYVEIDGVKFGTTRGGVGDSQATMDFNGTHTVAAGTTATVRVYCDTKTSSTAHTALTLIDLIGWIANGASTGTTIAFPGAVNGQDVTLTK